MDFSYLEPLMYGQYDSLLKFHFLSFYFWSQFLKRFLTRPEQGLYHNGHLKPNKDQRSHSYPIQPTNKYFESDVFQSYKK